MGYTVEYDDKDYFNLKVGKSKPIKMKKKKIKPTFGKNIKKRTKSKLVSSFKTSKRPRGRLRW